MASSPSGSWVLSQESECLLTLGADVWVFYECFNFAGDISKGMLKKYSVKRRWAVFWFVSVIKPSLIFCLISKYLTFFFSPIQNKVTTIWHIGWTVSIMTIKGWSFEGYQQRHHQLYLLVAEAEIAVDILWSTRVNQGSFWSAVILTAMAHCQNSLTTTGRSPSSRSGSIWQPRASRWDISLMAFFK